MFQMNLSPERAKTGTSFENILHSDLFTFLIGKDGKSVVVHSGAISALSPTLNTLINGGMIEAKKKVVTWPDVDVETFTRFFEFAYRGDYQPPEREIELYRENNGSALKDSRWVSKVEKEKEDRASTENSSIETIFAGRASDEYRLHSRKQKKKDIDEVWDDPPIKIPSNKVRVRREFENTVYSVTRSREAMLEECKPVPNKSSDENHTPVYLGHARLYVLADKYGVDALKTLALNKIHETLLKFTLYAKRIGDVVELVKFAYSDENTMDIEGAPDKLRALVVHYVVSEIDTITGERAFLELLEEGGAFVRDFWMKVKNEII